MNLMIFSSFIIYFLVLISIALYFYRTVKTASDFIIGSRSVNYWVTAIATQASDMGGWLFLGFPAAIYSQGLFEAWTAIGLVLFMFLNWHFIAPRLRIISEKTNSNTLSALFEKQFSDTTGLISLVSALFTLIFFTFYIASGLVGLGRLFESAFEIQYHTGIVIGLCTAILYTLIGGFIAAAWCDLFQGIFLLCMIILVPLVALFNTSGISGIIDAYQMHVFHFSFIQNMPYGLFLAAGWGLGYFGQPHILVNFMGIDNPKKISSAKIVGLTWQIIVLSASIAIGLIALTFFSTPVANPELIYILMTKSLFNPFIAGMALCAILAAVLSTMDRHILISGSVIASDLYHKIINPQASSQHILFITRIASIFVSLCALYIAWTGSSTIYGLVQYAWSGLGSAFGPLVIAALYKNKNITNYGALAGLIIGGTTAGLWPYINSDIAPLIPGFASNVITMYCVSLVTKETT
ncbi:MAG TPA: sodium/proline symporter [Candidatus Babeliales bacterium]|nr:sodium/proline symporter [Candidatus Babeliales bacterium]